MKKLLSSLLILLPVIWIFRQIFFGSLGSWGDAPFFYQEGLKELFNEPLSWTTRNISFGGINSVLWISPIMFLMGILNKFFFLGSDMLIRLLFYFPSIILSGVGCFLLVQYLKSSKPVLFFAPLFYILNSYFILLVDGGQVGVALAYGLFPLTIYFGRKMFDKTNVFSFFIFLLSLVILSVADPRILLVAILTLFIWQMFEDRRKILFLILSVILLIPINFYWILPLIMIKTESLSLGVSMLQLSSLLNSLLIYAPHWPDNVFGKIVQPPFYYIFIPILIFLGALLKKEKKLLTYSLIFLIFSFFAKGTTPPFGNLYNFLVSLPFGFAFRDSTKFFIPLILIGGILIGETVNVLKTKIKLFPALVYLYILFLIYPALVGNLNFILGNNKIDSSFETIYRNLNSESGSFKTLWFPEKHPLSFDIAGKEAADARGLVLLKPIAFMNASNDVFNFLNNGNYVDWLKVLGIKYLFLPGDTRNINPTTDETKDWQTISALVENTSKLSKVDWGIDFPAYKIEGAYPNAYSVKSLVGVIGPMLENTSPAVYFEDGKFDPSLLNGKDVSSLKIFFNGKGVNDLTMSFLQKYFVSSSDNISSQWAVYGGGENLNAKYELLIRGYSYGDFDYGKGIAFSTNRGEKVKFEFKVPEGGTYMLATRLGTFDEQSFKWKLEEKTLTKGSFIYDLENTSGFEVLNVVALVPLNDFESAKKQSDIFLANFGTVSKKDLVDQDWKEVNLNSEDTLKYEIEDMKDGYWIIYNQNYHQLWNLRKGNEYFKPFPIYSMVNGFYVESDWKDLHIEFRGQEYFRLGYYASVMMASGFLIIFLILIIREHERKNKRNISN